MALKVHVKTCRCARGHNLARRAASDELRLPFEPQQLGKHRVREVVGDGEVANIGRTSRDLSEV